MAVGEDRNIVTLNERVDAVAKVNPYGLLIGGLIEDAVESESLAALRGLYSEMCVVVYATGGIAKARGNEAVARIIRL